MGLNAQSNTGRCSSLSTLQPSTVSCSSTHWMISERSTSEYPKCISAASTDWFTIFNIPPPASALYFTRAMSGSTPVVSQSMRKAIVPVGANTVTCALRKPGFSSIWWATPAHTSAALLAMACAIELRALTLASWLLFAASRCCAITRSIGARLASYRSNGPNTSASLLLHS